MGALTLTPLLKSTAIHKRAQAGVGLEEEKHLEVSHRTWKLYLRGSNSLWSQEKPRFLH